MTETDRPKDWSELLERLRADPGMTAHGFGYYMRDIKEKKPASIGFGGGLMRAAETLNRGLVMGQRAGMSRIVTLLQARAREVARADDADMRARPASSQAMLACALVADLGGFGDWADLRSVAFARLWSRPPDGDRSDITTTWASLAWGHADRIAARIGLDAGPTGDGPPANTTDAPRQIARIMLDDGNRDDALPSWHAWLTDFPAALHDDRTNWNDLLWAARAVHVVIGKVAPADLPAHLVRELEAL